MVQPSGYRTCILNHEINSTVNSVILVGLSGVLHVRKKFNKGRFG